MCNGNGKKVIDGKSTYLKHTTETEANAGMLIDKCEKADIHREVENQNQK